MWHHLFGQGMELILSNKYTNQVVDYAFLVLISYFQRIVRDDKVVLVQLLEVHIAMLDQSAFSSIFKWFKAHFLTIW